MSWRFGAQSFSAIFPAILEVMFRYFGGPAVYRHPIDCEATSVAFVVVVVLWATFIVGVV